MTTVEPTAPNTAAETTVGTPCEADAVDELFDAFEVELAGLATTALFLEDEFLLASLFEPRGAS